MGSFYVNYTIKADDPASVARALFGRKAFVSPAQKGYVVVFDEESDNQDQEQIAKLAGQLSTTLRSTVLLCSITIAISCGISCTKMGS